VIVCENGSPKMGGGEDGHSEVEEGAVLAGRRNGSSLDGPLTFSEITFAPFFPPCASVDWFIKVDYR